jgi:hypothetical protein
MTTSRTLIGAISLAETYDAHRDLKVVERASLTVPAGDAFRVSYRYETMPDEPRFVFHEYHLGAGDGVARFSCSGVEPPGDDWLHIAEAIAPISTHVPASAPFDPRIEVPNHGLAVEFGDEWLMRAWATPGLLLGGVTVLRADSVAREGVGSSSECWVEDETGGPSLSGLSSRRLGVCRGRPRRDLGSR